MATGDFIAGTYTATYNAKALGQTADGFRLSHEVFKRIVTGDLGADTPQDAIYRGMAYFLSCRLIEAGTAGIADLVHPYTATIGTPWDLGKIGLLDVRGQGGASPVIRAKQVVLTAVTGTSAFEDSQKTITLPRAILAEGFPVEILLAPDLREVPVRMRIYPNMSTGVFGTQT
jgi:hypothetical protein